jgi:uncharacterized protein (DUF362 family)/Pyruvate/2-oxoacid:ferredoxin oxidoreductase delta subunit
MISQVSIVKCASYNPDLVEGSIRRSIALLGGIDKFIKPGSKVLVKPNLLMAKDPECAIDTHPEVLRAVIRILKEIKCRILVGDGPSVWGNQIENVEEVYQITGVSKVCQDEGVELVKFDKRRMHNKLPLTTYLYECDHLINLPKLKTHGFTILTGAIKNLFGLVPGTHKTELHRKNFDLSDFSKMLVDILQEARPSLNIVDGIMALEGDGPATSGKVKSLGLIIAGSDCVAVDSVMAKIMGLEPSDILTTKEAQERGLGVSDMRSIQVLGESLNDCLDKPFILPSSSLIRKKIPKPVIALIKKLIRFYPSPIKNECVRCFACINICPDKCITMGKHGIIFNYRKCISCFCCQETCPEAAIKVKKSLLARIIGI